MRDVAASGIRQSNASYAPQLQDSVALASRVNMDVRQFFPPHEEPIAARGILEAVEAGEDDALKPLLAAVIEQHERASAP